MRRRLLLGIGLAGALTGTAVGQFAADAKPLPPQTKAAPFGGAQPAAPPAMPATPPRTPPPTTPGYVQPVGGFAPAPAATGFTPAPRLTPTPATPPPVEIATSLGANHPWQVKPEHGAFFICVKSYARPARPVPPDVGPTARVLAEALGTEIRDTHKTNVFLFEHISEERRAEEAAIAAARQQQRELNSRLDEYKHRSQLQGMEFLGGDSKIRYKTVNYTEQIAVLIGGFKDEDTARKALDTIRKWPPPKQQELMDGGAIARQGPGGATIEKTRINPYAQAMVVPNPTVSRPRPADKLEDFVVKLNEGRPYNLLKATKGWTLGVKSFTAPVTVISGGEENGGMRRMGAAKGADALAAGAEQAETLAKAIRQMRGKHGEPLNLEAFVLHTRSASVVTVGQFDGPNDPSLLEARRLLMNLSFKTTEDKEGTRAVAAATAPKVFSDNMLPIPIPRH